MMETIFVIISLARTLTIPLKMADLLLRKQYVKKEGVRKIELMILPQADLQYGSHSETRMPIPCRQILHQPINHSAHHP